MEVNAASLAASWLQPMQAAALKPLSTGPDLTRREREVYRSAW